MTIWPGEFLFFFVRMTGNSNFTALLDTTVVNNVKEECRLTPGQWDRRARSVLLYLPVLSEFQPKCLLFPKVRERKISLKHEGEDRARV